MFEGIKESLSRCEDCGKSLFWESNIWNHPLKKGKLLCDKCSRKYDDYRRESYLKTLDEANTKMINDLYDIAMRNIKD